MTPVDAVGFLPAAQMPVPPTLDAQAAAQPTGFEGWMAREVVATNTRIIEAERMLQRVAAGDTSNLHQVMLDIERARQQFHLLTAVRNKVLEAYQDILRMQV